MPELRKSWLRRRVEDSVRRGFQHAYETVKVDPSRFLLQLRAAYGLPVSTFHGVYTPHPVALADVPRQIIRGATQMAAPERAGPRLGRPLPLVPGLTPPPPIPLPPRPPPPPP